MIHRSDCQKVHLFEADGETSAGVGCSCEKIEAEYVAAAVALAEAYMEWLRHDFGTHRQSRIGALTAAEIRFSAAHKVRGM